MPLCYWNNKTQASLTIEKNTLSENDLDWVEQYPISKVEDLPYAYAGADGPQARAKFKTRAADFIVREQLSFEPEGEGTHAYLYIEKTDTNTEWLARQIARFVGVEAREIGYAGLKDRHGITSQWFSINLEISAAPNWDDFQLEGVKILINTLHRKKLKRGAIKHNEFEIVLRDVQGTTEEELTRRVRQIQLSGVPNYFAQQRFGHDYGNLSRAARWFAGVHKIKKRADKSMALSAARSMVFNQMLSQRIQSVGWNKLIDGDIMMLQGTHSVFTAETIDAELQRRFQQADIHPTCPLWGRGRLTSEKQLLQMEQTVADSLSHWCTALEHQGLKQERRAARLIPENLQVKFSSSLDESCDIVTLNFSLPVGTYATAVLRELVQF